MAARVLLVDDHEIMREGISALLRKHPEFEVVGQAADGRKALELVEKFQPDVVLMDIGMPNLNGIEATRQILSQNPKIKVMALSTHSDGAMVAKMVKSGAAGYMLKESAFEELVNGIALMLSGKTFLCSKISKVVFSDYINLITNPKWNEGDGLSGREREGLQLVAEGHTTKEIANLLSLSPKTVDSHREHIMEKLGIRNVAGLTKYAIREGITRPEKNEHRPHQALNGRTPLEIYDGTVAAHQRPRYESRRQWPPDAPCAAPYAPPRPGQGIPLMLVVRFADRHKKLPIVELHEVA